MNVDRPFPFGELVEDIQNVIVEGLGLLDALFLAMTCKRLTNRIRLFDLRFKFGISHQDFMESIGATGKIELYDYLLDLKWDLLRLVDLTLLATSAIKEGNISLFTNLISESTSSYFKISYRGSHHERFTANTVSYLTGTSKNREGFRQLCHNFGLRFDLRNYFRGLVSIGDIFALEELGFDYEPKWDLSSVLAAATKGTQIECLKWLVKRFQISFTDESFGDHFMDLKTAVISATFARTSEQILPVAKYFVELGVDIGSEGLLFYCLHHGATEAFDFLEARYNIFRNNALHGEVDKRVTELEVDKLLSELIAIGRFGPVYLLVDRYPAFVNSQKTWEYIFGETLNFLGKARLNNRMRRKYFTDLLRFARKVESVFGPPLEAALFESFENDRIIFRRSAEGWDIAYFDPSWLDIISYLIPNGHPAHPCVGPVLISLAGAVPQLKRFLNSKIDTENFSHPD